MKRKALFTAALSMAVAMGSVVPVVAAPATETVQVAPIKARVEITLTQADKALLMDMFDAEYYASRYPDIVKAVGNDKAALFEHFLNHGLIEGRQLNKDFNVNAYRSSYKDLNAVLGTDIMAYYKHFQNFGKLENRTITNIEKAQEAGVIVSDFDGEHMAISANGVVVKGKVADMVIATNPVYANAVDNVGGTTRAQIAASVGVSSNVVLNDEETTETPAHATEEKKETVTSPSKDTPTFITVFNAEAFAKAHAEWAEREPQPLDFSFAYNMAYSDWQDEKPNRNDYVVEGNYDTAEEAARAYNSDMENWQDLKPEMEDFMSATELETYNKAVEEYEASEPKVEDYTYGENVFESQKAADEAKEIAIAAYNKYVEDKNAYDAKVAAMNTWTNKDKSEFSGSVSTKYVYDGTPYNTLEEAKAAAEDAGATEEDVVTKYYVGETSYDDEDTALTQAKENEKPEEPGEAPTVVDAVDDEYYKYHDYMFATQEEANKKYDEDHYDWCGKNPVTADFMTEEEFNDYYGAYDEWRNTEPDPEDEKYSYSNSDYANQTEADEAYVSDMESWGETEPDKESEEYKLTEDEQKYYEEAHDDWESWEPTKEDFTYSYDSKEFGSCVG